MSLTNNLFCTTLKYKEIVVVAYRRTNQLKTTNKAPLMA